MFGHDLEAAWDVFKQDYTRSEFHLDNGLSVTLEQGFFFGFGSTWCGYYEHEA